MGVYVGHVGRRPSRPSGVAVTPRPGSAGGLALLSRRWYITLNALTSWGDSGGYTVQARALRAHQVARRLVVGARAGRERPHADRRRQRARVLALVPLAPAHQALSAQAARGVPRSEERGRRGARRGRH